METSFSTYSFISTTITLYEKNLKPLSATSQPVLKNKRDDKYYSICSFVKSFP